MSSGIRFVKYNEVFLKAGMEEESNRMPFEFFDKLKGKVKEMRKYTIRENTKSKQEMVILTFWETKENMDIFYCVYNKALGKFVSKREDPLEKMSERNDYNVMKLEI